MAAKRTPMPVLSDYARDKKVRHFIERIPKDARVLEIGAGSGWAGAYMRRHGWTGYVGMDVAPPADVVGDIKDWASAGLEAGSFDVILAFEVVEHVACFRECFDLLRPGGLLMLTSPAPEFDWACLLLEKAGLSQPRTSPHRCVRFRDIPLFEAVDVRRFFLLSQWGIFRKPS